MLQDFSISSIQSVAKVVSNATIKSGKYSIEQLNYNLQEQIFIMQVSYTRP